MAEHRVAESHWQADRRRYPARPWLKEKSIWAVAIYRFGRWNDCRSNKFGRSMLERVYWVVFHLVEILTGIGISKAVAIGPGLRIYHFGNIFVHPLVRIGAHCTLRQGVTIGNRKEGGPVPLIGDDVEFGAYAQVLGGVRIGHRSKIGAMSVVLQDIPDDSTAVGNPARIIRHQSDTKQTAAVDTQIPERAWLLIHCLASDTHMSGKSIYQTLSTLSERPTIDDYSRPHTRRVSTIAFLVGAFPAVSETFVYREVLALRSRGWQVEVVSLWPASGELGGDLAGLRSDATILYGRPLRAIVSLISELALQPIRSLATLWTALSDAIFPAETLSMVDRIKLLAQGLIGICAAHYLRPLRVGHIHCHFAHAPTSVGMYAAIQLSVPFSFTGHANDLFQRRSLLKRKLERAVFVSCISEWHRRFYSTIHAKKGQYRLIRCGVPLDQWFFTNKTHEEESIRVLTVGRLVQKKGIDILIHGLSMWGRQTGSLWKLTVVGDGPEKAALEQLSRTLGCSHQISWLGAVDNASVREFMQQADIFALPCRTDNRGDRDGIPVAVMEAMACGVPVIVGDLPAIRELVSHGINGLLCDGDKPESVASCLAVLAASDVERQRLGNAGRQRIVQEFSLGQNIERLEHALCESFKPVQKESCEPVVA